MKVKPGTQPQNPNLVYLSSQTSLTQDQIIGRRTGQIFPPDQNDPDLHINTNLIFQGSNKKEKNQNKIPILITHYESSSSSSSNYESSSEEEAEEVE